MNSHPRRPAQPTNWLDEKWWFFAVQPAKRWNARELRRAIDRIGRLDGDAPPPGSFYPDGVPVYYWRHPLRFGEIADAVEASLRGVGGRWLMVAFGRDCAGDACEDCADGRGGYHHCEPVLTDADWWTVEP